MIGYDYTESKIGKDGRSYITFLTKPIRLDEHGLRSGEAVYILLNYAKESTEIYKFQWVRGIPSEFELIKRLKGEIITSPEIPSLMERFGINIKRTEEEENAGCNDTRHEILYKQRKPTAQFQKREKSSLGEF